MKTLHNCGASFRNCGIFSIIMPEVSIITEYFSTIDAIFVNFGRMKVNLATLFHKHRPVFVLQQGLLWNKLPDLGPDLAPRVNVIFISMNKIYISVTENIVSIGLDRKWQFRVVLFSDLLYSMDSNRIYSQFCATCKTPGTPNLMWMDGISYLERPRGGTVGKASASEARGPGFEPPWLVQRSRWESRSLSLVGNGAGAVTYPIDRKGSVFPRGTGRVLVKKDFLMHPFAVSSKKHSVCFVAANLCNTVYSFNTSTWNLYIVFYNIQII